MVEMLAAYLKIGVHDAIDVLVSKGLIDNSGPDFAGKLTEYINKNVIYRKRLLDFWKKIKGNESLFTREHLSILTVMGFDMRWGHRKAAGYVFGYCSKMDIIKTIRVTDSATEAKDSGYNRIFHGKGWNKVCVVPSFDMPGRIKTLTLFGNIQGGEVTVVNRHIAYRRWGAADLECGLMLLQDMATSKHEHNVVITDTLVGLKMAVSHAEINKELPPITVLPPDSSRISRSWNNLHSLGKEVILTGSRVEAMRATGNSYRLTKCDRVWDAPWMTVSKWLNAVVDQSYSPIVETSLIIKTDAEVAKPDDGGLAKYGGKTYEKSNTGIYELEVSEEKKEMVSDTLVRINEVISDGETTYYSGVVVRNGKYVTFREKESVIDEDIYKWLYELCRRHNMGMPILLKRFKHAAKAVFMLFHEPRYLSKLDYGDENYIAFKFTNFDVLTDGRVIELSTPRTMNSTHLCVHDELDMFEKSKLGQSDSAIIWAVSACVLSNALSDRFGGSKFGIGADPAVIERVRSIAEDLGCYIPPKETNADDIKKLMAGEAKRKFPVVLPLDSYDIKLAAVETEQAVGERNCIESISNNELYGKRMTARWVRIKNCSFTVPEDMVKAVRKISIGFLSWLISSNFRKSDTSTLANTVCALKKWCEKLDIGMNGIKGCTALIDEDLKLSDEESKAEAFKRFVGGASILGVFISNGRDTVDSKVMSIACKDFYKAVNMINVVVPDRSKLSDALASTGTVLSYGIFEPTGNLSWAVKSREFRRWGNHI